MTLHYFMFRSKDVLQSAQGPYHCACLQLLKIAVYFLRIVQLLSHTAKLKKIQSWFKELQTCPKCVSPTTGNNF